MPTLIRRLHLFAGLTLLVWVALYFVTGWVMVHEDWFPRRDADKQTRSLTLDGQGERNSGEFVRQLETTFDIHGKRNEPVRRGDGTWRFNWIRPGHRYEVTVSATGDRADFTHVQLNGVGVLHGLHRLHGYGGGPLYDGWVVAYDVASASMILFALSGIWLWWRQSAGRRLAGWVCLATGFGFTGAMIAYLMYSR
jgi:hypothetical protein